MGDAGGPVQDQNQGVRRYGMGADALALLKGEQGYAQGRVLAQGAADHLAFGIFHHGGQFLGLAKRYVFQKLVFIHVSTPLVP